MARPRFSASIRALALLLLLWGGFDIGLHGLLESDYAPIAPVRSAALDDGTGGTGPAQVGPDLCFCHGLSIGALAPVLPARLGLLGNAEAAPCSPVPHTDRHPLDQPPRPSA
jgi:hypothetical protein